MTGFGWIVGGGLLSLLSIKRPESAVAALPVALFMAIYGVAENARVGGPLTRFYIRYLSCVRALVVWLLESGHPHIKSVVGGLLGDFNGVLGLQRWFSRFDWVNPDQLTAAQMGMRPILCIHGKFGSPSQFGSLFEVMKGRPLFTVELPDPGDVTASDLSIVRQRIWEIQRLYVGVDSPKVDLIGYSRGAEVASELAFAWEGESLTTCPEIGRVVLLGTPFSDSLPPHVLPPSSLYEVVAKWDVLVPRESTLPPAYSLLLERCGHCGILTHEETLATVPVWLQAA